MKVHLQLYSILREKLPPEAKGRVLLTLEDGTTLAAVLEEMELRQRVVMSVNGIHETDRSRELHDGDEIKIFSSVSGGREVPDAP